MPASSFQKKENKNRLTRIRPVKVSYNVFGYAPSSVLYEIGNTKILCAVTLQQGVPLFLRGQHSGWLTAEYALLPTATSVRVQRDISQQKKNERSIEISRFIGRALRAIIDLSVFPDRSIIVDCDVLQADGGTRTACITGSYLALHAAQEFWLQNQFIKQPFLKNAIAAISIGIHAENIIVDPTFAQDTQLDADFNFVMTKSDELIEIQGGAEKKPLSWQLFEELRTTACRSIHDLFSVLDELEIQRTESSHRNEKIPLFSLINRHSASV